MTLLKLTANTPEQEKIKSYLQNNASEVLAEKINNGSPFEKDGKNLINKKTLDGFMQFAREEAKKFISDKEKTGYKVLCLDDDTVYGWAIHYFEEESIEGTLYNEDGTEYSPVEKRDDRSPAPPVPKKQKARPQLSLFDMLPPQKDDDKPTGKEIRKVTEKRAPAEAPSLPAPRVSPAVSTPKLQASPLYQRYLSVKEKHTDCIVFYRLSDFYEMFGNDAKTAAAELNLTLTSRDCGLSERIPMAGIPCHAVDAYISKLVSKGYKVAVTKSGNGNNRDVTRVVAPDPEQESVNEETGEILSESEMRQFDGDIEEPDDIPDDDSYDCDEFDSDTSAFDKEALIILSDLLGEIFILE